MNVLLRDETLKVLDQFKKVIDKELAALELCVEGDDVEEVDKSIEKRKVYASNIQYHINELSNNIYKLDMMEKYGTVQVNKLLVNSVYGKKHNDAFSSAIDAFQFYSAAMKSMCDESKKHICDELCDVLKKECVADNLSVEISVETEIEAEEPPSIDISIDRIQHTMIPININEHIGVAVTKKFNDAMCIPLPGVFINGKSVKFSISNTSEMIVAALVDIDNDILSTDLIVVKNNKDMKRKFMNTGFSVSFGEYLDKIRKALGNRIIDKDIISVLTVMLYLHASYNKDSLASLDLYKDAYSAFDNYQENINN